jgi:hypothetical protein
MFFSYSYSRRRESPLAGNESHLLQSWCAGVAWPPGDVLAAASLYYTNRPYEGICNRSGGWVRHAHGASVSRKNQEKNAQQAV